MEQMLQMATLLNIIDSVYRKNTGKMTTEASSTQKQNRGKHRLPSILPVSRILKGGRLLP
jgi:hypothetical protein